MSDATILALFFVSYVSAGMGLFFLMGAYLKPRVRVEVPARNNILKFPRAR